MNSVFVVPERRNVYFLQLLLLEDHASHEAASPDSEVSSLWK